MTNFYNFPGSIMPRALLRLIEFPSDEGKYILYSLHATFPPLPPCLFVYLFFHIQGSRYLSITFCFATMHSPSTQITCTFPFFLHHTHGYQCTTPRHVVQCSSLFYCFICELKSSLLFYF